MPGAPRRSSAATHVTHVTAVAGAAQGIDRSTRPTPSSGGSLRLRNSKPAEARREVAPMTGSTPPIPRLVRGRVGRVSRYPRRARVVARLARSFQRRGRGLRGETPAPSTTWRLDPGWCSRWPAEHRRRRSERRGPALYPTTDIPGRTGRLHPNASCIPLILGLLELGQASTTRARLAGRAGHAGAGRRRITAGLAVPAPAGSYELESPVRSAECSAMASWVCFVTVLAATARVVLVWRTNMAPQPCSQPARRPSSPGTLSTVETS